MFFFFKQKTAYEILISDWSSDVCSSDLEAVDLDSRQGGEAAPSASCRLARCSALHCFSISVVQPVWPPAPTVEQLLGRVAWVASSTMSARSFHDRPSGGGCGALRTSSGTR